MRPFTVLILILGAFAALIFAFVSLSGERKPHGTVVSDDLVVREAQAADRDAAPIAESVLPQTEAAPTPPVREEVATAVGVQGAHLGGIDGFVVGPQGEPVADARVHLLDVETSPLNDYVRLMNGEDPPKPKHTVVTDGTGTFRFESLKAGAGWSIVVMHDTYSPYEANGIEVPENGLVQEKITLEYALALVGFVLDADTGAPIEAAELVLDNPLASFLPSARQSRGRREATSDAQGWYGFKNMGGNQKTLVVRADGYATQVHNNFGMMLAAAKSADEPAGPAQWTRRTRRQMAEQSKLPKEPNEKNFELQVGHTIAGRVIGPNGEGIPDVSIQALTQSGTVGSRGDTVSRTDGEFLIENIAEGLYTLRAEADGFQSRPLQRIESDRMDVEIIVSELGSVSGQVLIGETGKPATNFTCKARLAHPRNNSWGGIQVKNSFHDRRNGAFTLHGLPDGLYVVEATARGYASSFSDRFEVTQGSETREIVVRLTKGGVLTGRVVDELTGDAIPGAKVSTNENNYIDSEFFHLMNTLSDSALTKTSVHTDEAGEFEIELITPDTYQVEVEKAGYTKLILNNVTIGDGSVTDIAAQSLSKGAYVSGTVYGPEGEPSAGAEVWLTPTDTNPWGQMQGRTDANGLFVLQNVKAGDYKLHASRPAGVHGHPFAPVVDMRNSEIEVSIQDGQEYTLELHMSKKR